jgi:hypothetical protein
MSNSTARRLGQDPGYARVIDNAKAGAIWPEAGQQAGRPDALPHINRYINPGSHQPTHPHVSDHLESWSGQNTEANDHGAYS